MIKKPVKECGEVPSSDVTWQVVLKVPEKHPTLTHCLVEAQTAFSAFQKANPKLGNLTFSDVVCTVVERRQEHALEPKRKRKTKKKP
jgi:hypothetical protein